MNTPGFEDKPATPSGTSGALTIDRAAFLLLRVKRAFKKKKQQRKDKSAAAAAAAASAATKHEQVPRKPKPLLRSRTLPAIVVPGINILQAQIEARYRKDGTVSDSAVSTRLKNSSSISAASLGVTAVHRHSSPEPPPGHVEAMLRLTPPPPNSLSRAYRVTAGSSTALYRLAKLLNATTKSNSSSSGGGGGGGGGGGVSPSSSTGSNNTTRRLSWERKDSNTSGLPRSSSIDSFVDTCSQQSSVVPGLGRGSPSSAASPGTIRRLKGPRAIQERHDGMEFFVDGLNLGKNARKKLDKLARINIHLHALFAAVEHGHVDRVRTILESTDVDVNSVNADGLSPLDIAVLNHNRQLAKMLVAFGAQEGNQFKNPESLGSHLKQLVAEAERRVQELGGGLSPLEPTTDLTHHNNNNNNNNNNNHNTNLNRLTTTPPLVAAAAGAGAEKQLLLWERRAKGLKKMLLGFDQARPPDAPARIAAEVVGTGVVCLRLQEPPDREDSPICTKYKVQWAINEHFLPPTGEREVLDMKRGECRVGGLDSSQRYFFRVACGNLKGYGPFRATSPATLVPSCWRAIDGRECRFTGRCERLEHLFSDVRDSRPESAAELRPPTTTTGTSTCTSGISGNIGTGSGTGGTGTADEDAAGETTPAPSRRVNRTKKGAAIKQLFTAAAKFQKNLRRGVFLACVLYNEDKVLVTSEDFLPVVEVDETYPSCFYNDFHWLMKVACTWEDVKSLRQDMEKSLNSSAVHFRIKLLQAAAQMQTALSIQDLGQLYHRPIRDSQGTLVLSAVCHIRYPKDITTALNSRWMPLSKVQRKASSAVAAAGEANASVAELLMASIQDQVVYHQASTQRISRGLYLGYLKMRSSVDLLQVVVSNRTPNVLPHVRIRDNPHVTAEEWDTLRRHCTSRLKSNSSTTTTTSNEMNDYEPPIFTETQRQFLDLITSSAKRLFSYMDLNNQEALAHRLYDTEVIELSPDVAFMVTVPPVESSCAAPGQREALLERGNSTNGFLSLPVQVFEMAHLTTYHRDLIARYSRLSCVIEVDTVLANHSHREAFSAAEVSAAKERLAQLAGFQQQLTNAWQGARWLMDVFTFARDRSAGAPLLPPPSPPPISPNSTSSNSSSSGGGVKRAPLLELPPRDPKLVKSSSVRGSWPGPGIHPATRVACLLTAELSKSEQTLQTSITHRTPPSSSSSATAPSTPPGLMPPPLPPPRLPASRSEDALLMIGGHHRGPPPPPPPPPLPVSTTPNQSETEEASGQVCAISLPETLSEDLVESGSSGALTAPSSPGGTAVIQVYAAYDTGLATGTCLKLRVTPRTTAREVVDLVIKQLNVAVVLKGKAGPVYSQDQLSGFCLVAVIGARERCLRDDFRPLQLQNPWKKGRLYVRHKQDVLAALEHSARHTAYL